MQVSEPPQSQSGLFTCKFTIRCGGKSFFLSTYLPTHLSSQCVPNSISNFSFQNSRARSVVLQSVSGVLRQQRTVAGWAAGSSTVYCVACTALFFLFATKGTESFAREQRRIILCGLQKKRNKKVGREICSFPLLVFVEIEHLKRPKLLGRRIRSGLQ